jgi:CDP-diacylglycerol--serine O-phosphatidyltransferase
MLAFGVPGREISVLALLITLYTAGMMVSNISFWSPKAINLKGRVSFLTVLAVVLCLVIISYDPPRVLFLGFALYALSGPLAATVRAWQRRHATSTASSESKPR